MKNPAKFDDIYHLRTLIESAWWITVNIIYLREYKPVAFFYFRRWGSAAHKSVSLENCTAGLCASGGNINGYYNYCYGCVSKPSKWEQKERFSSYLFYYSQYHMTVLYGRTDTYKVHKRMYVSSQVWYTMKREWYYSNRYKNFSVNVSVVSNFILWDLLLKFSVFSQWFRSPFLNWRIIKCYSGTITILGQPDGSVRFALTNTYRVPSLEHPCNPEILPQH